MMYVKSQCKRGPLWAVLGPHAGLPESVLWRSGVKLKMVQRGAANVSQDL